MARIDCRTVETIEKGQQYFHPNAVSDGGCSDGCCDDYKCPDCGTEFRVELPE